MEYERMLYEEYTKTLPSHMNQKYITKENFNSWVEERKKILPLYMQFLISFDLTPSKGIIEINKHDKDSVLPYTPFETKGFLVSKYVNTKVLNKKGIMYLHGNIILVKNNDPFDKKENNIIMEYQGNHFDISDVKNFITHYPIDNETIELMIKLMKTDRNVFIGIYGKTRDNNSEENLKKLYNLKQTISKYLNKNIDGEVTYTKDYYLAAITPKLKYKEKSK